MRFTSTLLTIALLLLGARASGVEPGDNLVLQNIPDIPQGLAARVARYQNMRSAGFQSWLADDNGMLITTRFAQTGQVHQVLGAGSQRTQLTFYDERVAWARHRPGKGATSFLFGMDAGGTEAYQIYQFDRATGQAALLTDGHSRNMTAVWDRQGERFAYASTKRNGRDFDLYLARDDKPAEAQALAEVKGLHLPLDFTPDGKQLLVMHYVSINESHLYLVNTATGFRTDLTPADERGVSYRDAKFSADGKRVYLTTDKGWEFVRLVYVDLADAEKEIKPVTPKPDWDVEAFDVSPDGRHVAYVLNDGGFSKLHLIDARRHKPVKVPELPPGLVTGLAFSPSGRHLAIGLSGARISGDVFVLDTKRRKLTRWTTSETGGLSVEAFAEPELIHYPTFDEDVEGKRQIPALLYLPPSKKFPPPWPVLVAIHGGPEGQARPTFLGAYNYPINEMGVALVRPNVRGSAGYGKNYLLLDNGKLRENAVKDVGALLDWIATREDLDQSRVAVTGGSYGGYMSLASLITYPDRFRCGVDYCGISSFITFLKNTKPYRQDLRRAEYGDERKQGMSIFLDMISPLSNAHKIKVPLLVLQGANDPRVPASEAEQIVEKVRGAGGQVWYLLAKDEGHGFAKKHNRDFANLTTILFLERFLIGR